MNLTFSQNAWSDYLYWQKTDKTILKRVNILIEDILRHPTEGIGKPEVLKYQLKGCYSRRINQEHRLVYRIKNGDEIQIIAVRYHY
ncbi:MAG: Txe/YoeB family addiction module toxin [Thiotrichales bacterium]|nr:MAG: Txe/YoeB family addiction module toxin [Thiotrichales bacterium]